MSPCTCIEPEHEKRGCGDGEKTRARGRLFAGLFDAPGVVERQRVRLLNPFCTDEDATARRFAQVEIE